MIRCWILSLWICACHAFGSASIYHNPMATSHSPACSHLCPNVWSTFRHSSKTILMSGKGKDGEAKPTKKSQAKKQLNADFPRWKKVVVQSDAKIKGSSSKFLIATCTKGAQCMCANSKGPFQPALNVIGANDGLGGVDLLMESRCEELDQFSDLLEEDLEWQNMEPKIPDRRHLIQISQCPGIGKTTLLNVFGRKFEELLRKHDVKVPEAGSIVSLVTYNGNVMTSRIDCDDLESAFCVRVLYAALRSHSPVQGMVCPCLKPFDVCSNEAALALVGISLATAIRILWLWFGPDRPIFIGVDECIKCKDAPGISTKTRLNELISIIGSSLESSPLVFAVVSSLSGKKLLRAIENSNRELKNIAVSPLPHQLAIDNLRLHLQKMHPKSRIDERVLSHLAAISSGHPRALGKIAKFMSKGIYSNKLGHFDACRPIFWDVVCDLCKGTTASLASQPDPLLLERILSTEPLSASLSTIVLGRKMVEVDDLVYTGQIMEVRGNPSTYSVGAWWVVFFLMGYQEILKARLPFSWLFQQCYRAVAGDVKNLVGNLWESFCLFFIASATVRGNDPLRVTIPLLAVEYTSLLTSGCKGVQLETMPAVTTPRGWAKILSANVRAVKARVDELIAKSSKDGKVYVLVMPPKFPVLDAIVIYKTFVQGCQFKSQIAAGSLVAKLKRGRRRLDLWCRAKHDILGSTQYVTYYVGVQNKPEGLDLKASERLVSSEELGQHFANFFFRFGLTPDEGQ